jgi:hypothetical protein
VIAAVLMTAAHLILVGAHSQAGVAVGVMVAGVAFGSVWPLMVLTVGELFGRANMGVSAVVVVDADCLPATADCFPLAVLLLYIHSP